MSKKASILEALRNWRRPDAPTADHKLVMLMRGLLPSERLFPDRRWTSAYTNNELLDKAEKQVGILLGTLPNVPKSRPIDPRLRPEIAVAEALTKRAEIVHPHLEELGKIVASALRERIGAKKAFAEKVLALSEDAERDGTPAMIAELRNQETRSKLRAMADQKGLVAVADHLRAAMDAGRFDVVQAAADDFPSLVDVAPIRMAWARERYPEVVGIEHDLDEALSDTAKAGQSLIGVCRVLADREICSGTGTVQAPDWKAPEVLTAAMREAGYFNEIHGETMKALANAAE